MDPYLDTIPDDDGEEIKELVRERDERPTKRARTDTSDFLHLPSDGDRQFPKPEDDLEEYDRERLQQGLRYIDGATGAAKDHRITPRTRAFLKLHKEAYKIALDDEGPDQASRAVVQAMERVYFGASYFFEPRSSEEHDRLENYLNLRRLELIANYGDYLGQELQEIRADLKEAATQGADSETRQAAPRLGPPKTSIDIKEGLAGADATDLRKHVDYACDVLGIDVHHMLWLIAEWAERNRTFHNQTRMLISECRWNKVAQQISRDLKDLINVAPDEEMAANYERVILSIQNEYFEIINRDDPHSWFPSEKAKELTREKLARKERAQE